MANKQKVTTHEVRQERALTDKIERMHTQGKTVEILERYTTNSGPNNTYERTRGIMGEAQYARVLVTVNGERKRWRYETSSNSWKS